MKQIAKPRNLILARRHYQLSADLVRYAVLRTEFDHLADALNREARLRRSWFVIETRVQNSAVVAGLVKTHLGFLLQHRDGDPGTFAAEPVGGGETHYA